MDIKIILTDDQKSRWNIKDKICCVYLLKNTINGKMYVGQTRNLRKRLSHYHTEVQQPGPARLIIESIRYFGESAFEASVLEECTLDRIDEVERKWIRELKTLDENFGYNEENNNYIYPVSFKELESKAKSLAHMGLKADPESKRKRSNKIIAIDPNLKIVILSDSGKLLGDFLGTTKDMIKNCLREPSRYRGIFMFYFDFNKRNEIRNKMYRKRSIRNTEYIKCINLLNDYEFESVETIYTFIKRNIGELYILSYDYIENDNVPCIFKAEVINNHLFINENEKILKI